MSVSEREDQTVDVLQQQRYHDVKNPTIGLNNLVTVADVLLTRVRKIRVTS